MPLKHIYDFSLPKTEEVEESDSSQNEKGETVTVTKKVTREVPQKFFLCRPTRAMHDEAELYRSVKFSEAVRAGVLTHDLLTKRLANDDGILSEKEREHYNTLYKRLFEIRLDYQTLALKKDEEKTTEEREKQTNLFTELKEVQTRIQEFEATKGTLFDQTAEVYARNKIIFWWALHLAYKAGEKEEPFFGGKTHEEKLKSYDTLEELDDPFTVQVIQKILYLASLWFVTGVKTQEEFDKVLAETDGK